MCPWIGRVRQLVAHVPVTITGPNNSIVTIQATVQNTSFPKRDAVVGFVESNGYVSMEAAHFTRAVNGVAGTNSAAINWQCIPDPGAHIIGYHCNAGYSEFRARGHQHTAP